MNEEIRKAAQAFPESGRKLPAIVLGASDERPAIHAKIKKLTYRAPSRIGFRVNEEIRKAAQAFPEMRDLKLLQRLVAALATNEGVQSKRTEILQRLKSLSSREVDVLCYVLGGQLNREIAVELGVSERTIKAHRGRVMKKLGVRSTAQLFPMVWRVLCESGCKVFYKPRRRIRRPNLRTTRLRGHL